MKLQNEKTLENLLELRSLTLKSLAMLDDMDLEFAKCRKDYLNAKDVAEYTGFKSPLKIREIMNECYPFEFKGKKFIRLSDLESLISKSSLQINLRVKYA